MFMLLFKRDIQNVYAAILYITMKAYNEQELSSSKMYKININQYDSCTIFQLFRNHTIVLWGTD